MHYRHLLIFGLILIIWGCQKSLPESILSQIDELKIQYAPDKRTTVFSFEVKYEKSRWNISGETNIPEVKQKIDRIFQSHFAADEIQMNFLLLPSDVLGDSTNAIVRVSVANLRKTPKHSAEMVDQVTMGTKLKILKKQSYWYLVQTPYDYLGWITRGSVKLKNPQELDEWLSADKVLLNENFAMVYSDPSAKSQPVCDAVLGSVFKIHSINRLWSEVELPDKRTGYINSEYLIKHKPGNKNQLIDRNAVIADAKKLMGIPYLWGGNSSKGLDCSGFTQTIFENHGIQLPRDANMQVEMGEEITPDENYSNILAGDLIFFGPENRITHVGICLGGSYFIHSSGDVHVNSLDENDPLFNEFRKKTFKHIKRIISDEKKDES